jgi:hypothetical protein
MAGRIALVTGMAGQIAQTVLTGPADRIAQIDLRDRIGRIGRIAQVGRIATTSTEAGVVIGTMVLLWSFRNNSI